MRKIGPEPFIIEIIETWSDWLLPGEYNWREFTFWQFDFEDDVLLGALEFTFVLFGLGIRMRWTHTKTQAMEDIRNSVKYIQDRED